MENDIAKPKENYVEYPTRYFVPGNENPDTRAFFILCSYDKEETPLLGLEEELNKKIGKIKESVKEKEAREKMLRYVNRELQKEIDIYIKELEKMRRVSREDKDGDKENKA